ncbi:50S ribosomal protein L4 [Candidatus Woesearchaeota archaeon]|nr:50S ribosomal protein L4 [Candidatus Woesearchaeota archaeon]
MKLKVYSLEKTESGEIELPSQFDEEFRPDLIKRAFIVIQNNKRQPYGAKEDAGKRASAVLSRRRHDYRGSYGHGISRVPRKIMSRRGERMNWVGAFAPGTVGGRRAHPPKSEKNWKKDINKKERRKAIRSSISATILSETVKKRGHIIPNNYPFIIESKIEAIEKTKDVKKILEKFELKKELDRIKKKIRPGKGTRRGRKYRINKGPLFVVSKKCNLINAAANIAGVDVTEVKNLNVELLAPGANAGRLTLWTDSAIKLLEEKKLFK